MGKKSVNINLWWTWS